jgi:tRNA1Val (adenine37-N6)-methyltransferase
MAFLKYEEQGVMSEETIDELRGYDLRIMQRRDGYRFSLDPLLLCDFAAIGEGGRVVDLGAGSGIIPLLLARKSASVRIVGIELQEEMAALAGRNVVLNGLSDRIEIIGADILSLRDRFPVSCIDLVTANPPYRRPGSGKISPKAGRDKARHETTATLTDFLEAAKYLVKPTGTIVFTYLPLRLAEFCATAAALKLAPLRMRMVHGNARACARMLLIEVAKGRRTGLEVLPPFIVYGADGEYSEELKRILRV